MARIDPITAMYEIASIAKHHASPKPAISSPPIDGPMMRVPLTIDEFSAIAFGRSRLSSTISLTNAWRAGVSKELMIPCTTWSQMICRTVMTFMNVRMASSAD